MPATNQPASDAFAVVGDMTFATASEWLTRGVAALAQETTVFDLTGVDNADSASLAIIFGWQRAAMALGKTLQVNNAPPGLLSLAAVYGVSELLPLQPGQPQPATSQPLPST